MIKIESNYFTKKSAINISVVHFEKDDNEWNYIDELYIHSDKNQEQQINDFIRNSGKIVSNLTEVEPNVFASDTDMFKIKNSKKRFLINNGKVVGHA